MKITDVVAYAVKYPAEYIFTRPADPRTRESDYFVRPGFPTVYSTHNEALLVRIETDQGPVGWGEALAPVVPESAALVVARLVRPPILGADPCDVEPLWNRIYDAMRVRGHLTGLYVAARKTVSPARPSPHGAGGNAAAPVIPDHSPAAAPCTRRPPVAECPAGHAGR